MMSQQGNFPCGKTLCSRCPVGMQQADISRADRMPRRRPQRTVHTAAFLALLRCLTGDVGELKRAYRDR
jgi:hypothetical protein